MRYAAWGAAKNLLPSGGGVWLSRVGGLSPTPQSKRAPEKKGFWAFIWPFLDLFMIGSTNEYGVVDHDKPYEGANKPRSMRVRERIEKIRKFKYEGLLWTYWDSAARYAIQRSGRWCLVHTDDFRVLLKEHIHEAHNFMREHEREFSEPGEKLGPTGGPLNLSVDAMEVFVPANKGRVFGKPEDSPPAEEDEYGEVPRRKLRSPRVPRPRQDDY